MTYSFSLVRFTSLQIAIALGVSVFAYVLQKLTGHRMSGILVSVVSTLTPAVNEGQRQAKLDGKLLERDARLNLGNWMLLGTVVTSLVLVVVSLALVGAENARSLFALLSHPLALSFLAAFFFLAWLTLPYFFNLAAKAGLKQERET